MSIAPLQQEHEIVAALRLEQVRYGRMQVVPWPHFPTSPFFVPNPA